MAPRPPCTNHTPRPQEKSKRKAKYLSAPKRDERLEKQGEESAETNGDFLPPKSSIYSQNNPSK